MKKKYIIALEDRNVWSCGVPAKTLLLSDVSIFGTDLASVNTGIELTPYTEPDLEQVRKEAYDKCMDEAEMLAYKLYSPKIDEAYQRGLSDAWEAARKVVALSTVDRRNVFGSEYMYSILEKHTASEAIEKIRQYEQEKGKIQVGDEVTFLPNNAKGIVTECHVPDVYSDNDKYAVWCGGTMEYVLKQHLTKTGRTFPEIAEVLAKMKESDNG